MRHFLPPLAAGTLGAAFLYGLLSAAARDLPPPEDPWLDAWVAAGQPAQFRSISTEPHRHFGFNDARDLLKGPEFQGTVLRSYLVRNTSTQVVRLPREGLLPELPEGDHREFRLKEKGGAVNLVRRGRTLLLVSMQGKWIPFAGQMKTSKEEFRRIAEPFLEALEHAP